MQKRKDTLWCPSFTVRESVAGGADYFHKKHARPLPYGQQPNVFGISHGLKTCHRHVFFTPFRVPYGKKRKDTLWCPFFFW